MSKELQDLIDIEDKAIERVAYLLERRGINLDPDAGTETGDPAEYLTCQILDYINRLTEGTK